MLGISQMKVPETGASRLNLMPLMGGGYDFYRSKLPCIDTPHQFLQNLF